MIRRLRGLQAALMREQILHWIASAT